MTVPRISGGRAGLAAALVPGWACGVAVAAVLAAVLPGPARAMVGEGADEGVEPVISQGYTVVPADRLAAAVAADRAYVTGMRAHHAGALTMSEAYLADPAAGSPALRGLARAIMHNQRFEIALMDAVAGNLERAPTVLSLGGLRLTVQPSAFEGLALPMGYMRYPVPGPLTPAAAPGRAVTERDVQFAKAMTIHHQGALEMAAAYQADPNGRNSFLGQLNVDIVTDQTQEIAFMRRVVAAYPGDAAAVPVPAGMIHGMEGMSHGGHGGPRPLAGMRGMAGRLRLRWRRRCRRGMPGMGRPHRAERRDRRCPARRRGRAGGRRPLAGMRGMVARMARGRITGIEPGPAGGVSGRGPAGGVAGTGPGGLPLRRRAAYSPIHGRRDRCPACRAI